MGFRLSKCEILSSSCDARLSTTVASAFISRHGILVWQTLYGTGPSSQQRLPFHQTKLVQKEQATMVRGIHALAMASAFGLN